MHIDIGLIKRVFKFLVPLNDPWRLVVGCAIFFLTVNMLASRGWLTVMGLGPFASASSVTEIRIEQLDSQLESTVKGHCLAPTEQSKSYYYSKLQELIKKYNLASPKEKYQRPRCKDLGVKEVIVGGP